MGKILAHNLIQQELQLVKDKKILVGGCFDILHSGHIHFLSSAKKIGGTLVVLLESDEKIKAIKGNERPVNAQKERAYLLSALADVDYIILLPHFTNDQEYEKLISIIQPDYFAITKDDPVNRYVKKYAQQLNSRVVEVIDRLSEYSTSKIIKQLNT
jgi:rfaE bifunctional protein nucleotidyltransferase chain/domain